MARSRYFEPMSEEEKVTRAEVGAFASVEELGAMLKRRAEFANKIQHALTAGEITQQQYDALTQLNRQHALPRGAMALPFGSATVAAAPKPSSSRAVAEPHKQFRHRSLASICSGLLRWLAGIRF
jgi:hypothetical protein